MKRVFSHKRVIRLRSLTAAGLFYRTERVIMVILLKKNPEKSQLENLIKWLEKQKY